MPFPTNEKELAEQGYEFEGTGRCSECHAEIAWYRTPKGKRIPLDEGTLVAHWGTCTNPDRFRRPKK